MSRGLTATTTTARARCFLMIANTFQTFLHDVRPCYGVDVHVLVPLIVAKPLSDEGKAGMHLIKMVKGVFCFLQKKVNLLR